MVMSDVSEISVPDHCQNCGGPILAEEPDGTGDRDGYCLNCGIRVYERPPIGEPAFRWRGLKILRHGPRSRGVRI